MSQIKILSDRVANQIAAGEVIERPVAVVKELVENSIDAQATRICIAIKNGGKSYIKVSDNGIGMDPDEALIALERHATSKLTEASDLNTIRSFGFRGEALPSIASVSNFLLKTKKENAIEGVSLFISAGKLIESKACGMPHGTSVEVSQLFKGVPARRKFQKTEATETAHIYNAVRLFALAHPSIAFELSDNGRTVMQSPACSELSDRISEIWNQNLSKDLLALNDSCDSKLLHLNGLISKTGTFRSSKREMIFFVNKRPVENKTLNYAVLDAYSNSGRIPKGKFPLCFLFIDIDPSEIDVNIHPTKREIKFKNENLIRQMILEAVHSKLDEATNVTKAQHSVQIESFPEAKPLPIFKSKSAPKTLLNETAESYSNPLHEDSKTILKKPDNQKTAIPTPTKTEVNYQSNWKFIDILNNKWALYQTSNGLVLLNVLRANQRLYFESITNDLKHNINHSQDLLIPIQLKLELFAANTLKKYLPDLKKNGFQLESLGKEFYRLLSIPNWLDIEQAESFIDELINQLSARGNVSKLSDTSLTGDLLAKLAIEEFYFKQPETSPEVLKAIPSKLFKCKEPMINPLGKMIFWEITWSEIEKKIR